MDQLLPQVSLVLVYTRILSIGRPFTLHVYANSYEHLKSTIYRFEKNALVAPPPPATYSDDPNADLESARLLSSNTASSYDASTPSANEKVFIQLLDKELRKIVEFYEIKERELLSDLEVLRSDIERIEEEDEAHHSGVGGNQSVDSDEEDQEETVRGAIESVLSNPTSYEEAARAGRKVRGIKQHRRRASSNISGTSEDDQNRLSRSVPQSPMKARRPSLGRSQSRMTRNSKGGLSAHYDEDDIDGLGIWGKHTDWAIDTKIMYKRRVTAVFTVRCI